jgi:hypothetical protein
VVGDRLVVTLRLPCLDGSASDAATIYAAPAVGRETVWTSLSQGRPVRAAGPGSFLVRAAGPGSFRLGRAAGPGSFLVRAAGPGSEGGAGFGAHPFAADRSSVRAAFDLFRRRLPTAALHSLMAARGCGAEGLKSEWTQWSGGGMGGGMAQHNGDAKLLAILLADCLVDRLDPLQ